MAKSHPKNLRQLLPEYCLVVEPTPLKNMKVSWDGWKFPTEWKNNPVMFLKPPSRISQLRPV